MPRVTSHKTRQAILATGEVFDVQRTEYLALFDSDGNPVTATLSPRGAWDPFAAYPTNAVVTYGGSTYRAKESIPASELGANQNPASATEEWEILAERGIPGIRWRGDWHESLSFEENDAVLYEGTTYRAMKQLDAPTSPPDTPQGIVPGTLPGAGSPSELWDTTSNVREGLITESDPLVSGLGIGGGLVYVEIVRVPIATAGTMQVIVQYEVDGYLYVYRPDGSLLAFNDDSGNILTSAISAAVVPGTYYLLMHRRNGSATPTPAGPYTATINLSDGATFGEDTDPWGFIAKRGDDGPIGPEGPEGPIGPEGPEGPEGPIGPSGVDFNYQGDWVAQDYAQGVTVRHLDALWFAESAALATDEPGTAALWSMVLEDILQTANGLPSGGDSSQILAKNTATDYDVGWVDPPSGSGGVEIVTSKRFFESLDASPGSICWADTGAQFHDAAVFDGLPGMMWSSGGENNSYSREEAFRDFDAQIKFTLSAAVPSGGASWAMMRRVSSSRKLMFFTDFFNGIHLFKWTGSSWVLVISTPLGGVTFSANGDYWLRAQMDNAGFITMGLYSENPRLNTSAVPLLSLTHQLAGSDLTDFGPAKTGHPGLRLIGSATANHLGVRMREYEVNEYVQTTAPATVIDGKAVIVP